MKTLGQKLTLFALFLTLSLSAQESKFGYLDFNGTLKLMPDYKAAEVSLQKMQADYKLEIDRSKGEFERQYIEFMLEQDHLSASVVAKRQKELQLLMDNNAQFRDRVQEELEAARIELLDPLKKKLLVVISEVCTRKDLDYVIDTGTHTYLFINDKKGVDISHDVYAALGIESSVPDAVTIDSGKSAVNNK
jgi:Skp family chaperone for outer membrane proteins